jgi:hypothetical protein
VGEAELRRALESGSVTVGATLSPEAERALLASSTPVSSVRLPVTPEVVAGLLVGASESLLVDADVEIAQQAAGVAVVDRGAFSGFVGTVRVTALPSGAVGLELDGTLGWRAADATVDLAFRAPVGMDFHHDATKLEDPRVRRVPLPFGSRGVALLQARASFPREAAGGARTALVAVVSRQGGESLPETVVVLASLR